MSEKQEDEEEENTNEREKELNRTEIRNAFYHEHIDDLIIDRKMPHLKNAFLIKLAKECKSNVKTEHLAWSLCKKIAC